MFYIVVHFQAPSFNTFRDMTFFLVWFSLTWHPDRWKAMHISPLQPSVQLQLHRWAKKRGACAQKVIMSQQEVMFLSQRWHLLLCCQLRGAAQPNPLRHYCRPLTLTQKEKQYILFCSCTILHSVCSILIPSSMIASSISVVGWVWPSTIK